MNLKKARIVPPRAILLLSPILIMLLGIYAPALLLLGSQSFQSYFPGKITQDPYVFTFTNYLTYTRPFYVGVLLGTLQIGGLSALISVLIAYPVSYKIARARSRSIRKLMLTLLVISFFISSLMRIYSWRVLLSDSGTINQLITYIGGEPVGFLGQFAIISGLIHFLFPVAALVLMGPISNINPDLEEAAQGLGATRSKTALRVTLPLSLPGIIGAWTIAYALGVSAFLVPEFLGRGGTPMMANIVFARFSLTFNYPAGAAMSIILLVTTFFIIYVVGRYLNKFVKGY